MFIVVLLVLTILTWIAIEFGSKYLVVWLGQQDEWWSPLRTKPISGQYYYIVKGTEKGPLHMIVENIPGWHLSGAVFVEDVVVRPPVPTRSEAFWDKMGLVWVGFFKKYYLRTRRYDTLEHGETGTGQSIVPKARDKHLFFFQTGEMVVTLKEIDTVGNIPIDAVISFTTRIVNPVLAEFLAGKWEEQVTNAVTSAARNYIESKTYDELRDEKDAHMSAGLMRAILAANFRLSLKDLFGVEIIQPRLHSFDPSPGSAEAAAALQKEAIAKLEQNAVRVEAETARIQAKGRADAIKKVLAAQNSVPNGPAYAIAEAIRESKPNTLVIGEGLLAIPPATPR